MGMKWAASKNLALDTTPKLPSPTNANPGYAPVQQNIVMYSTWRRAGKNKVRALTQLQFTRATAGLMWHGNGAV